MAFKLKGFTPFTYIGPGFHTRHSFRSPGSVKWELDRKRRQRAADDKKWAEYKEKRKKKRAERKQRRAAKKAKKNSPFKRKTYMGKPIKRTLNPFDRHHGVKNDLGYNVKKRIITKKYRGPGEGGAGGGKKDLKQWAKRNRG